MGISLNGLTPAGTYPGLIKTGDNTAISGTPKVLSDGNGNDLPMEVSTTGVNFTNNLTQGGTALQPVLVSGTNIKTINGASVLGSGDIVTPSTPPSGVAGAIQFSAGSAFNSDASNLFWDDTNKRLGVGTNAPSATGHFIGVNNLSTSFTSKFESALGQGIMSIANDGGVQIGDYTGSGYTSSLYFLRPSGGNRAGRLVQSNTDLTLTNAAGGFVMNGLQCTIKGSGSTSATTSLLVQNSAGTELLKVSDNGTTSLGGLSFGDGIVGGNPYFAGIVFGPNFRITPAGTANFGAGGAANASAQLEITSTTKGFLPPRMTTTQKNAIASPATGLVLYDSTTNKLCCYNGSTWNDLF